MKFLHQDRTSSVTAGSELSGFPDDNVENDRPRQPWISTTQSSETFTINLNASATYPIQAMFLHGLLADTATWVLKNQAGSTIDSGTLTTTFPLESDLAGNANTGNTYFENQAHLLRSFFIEFSSTVTDNGSIVLTLTTSDNQGDKNILGNAVANWNRTGASAGNLRDSSDAAINIFNHRRIFVGSHINAGTVVNPLVSNSTVTEDSLVASSFVINGGVTLTINGGKTLTVVASGTTTAQITSITGDGTSAGAIALSADLPSASVAQVYNPIRIGVARAGTCLDLPNPAPEMNFGYNDYSVRRRQPTGGYSHQQRPIGRRVSMQALLSTEQAHNLQDFYRGYRSKPVPVLFLEDMPAGFAEARYGNLFAFFTAPPEFTLINSTHQSVSMDLTEVI